jgi:hypothetical protein
VAERAASPERLGDLERAYGLVVAAHARPLRRARRALPRARQFERRGARTGPSPTRWPPSRRPHAGVTFVLLARLAERTGQHAEMLRAIERAAGASLDDGARAEWMRRAASFAGRDPEGRRQRVDVLLRALALRPDVTSLRHLVAADAEAIARRGRARIMAVRFARALRALIPGLAGPDGARVALELATGALAVFGDAALADEAIARALECDAPSTSTRRWSLTGPRSRPTLGSARRWSVAWRPSAPIRGRTSGAPRGARRVRRPHRGDAAAVARLLLGMAGREPDDAELGARATAAVRAVGVRRSPRRSPSRSRSPIASRRCWSSRGPRRRATTRRAPSTRSSARSPLPRSPRNSGRP